MTQYGFRLFAVELHQGRKALAMPFGAAALPVHVNEDGTQSDGKRLIDYRETLGSDVIASIGRAHKFGTTDESDDGSGVGEANGMAIRFKSTSKTETARRLQFEFGICNVDGTLIFEDPENPDIELKGLPTLYPYRASLVANEDSVRGILAVEARGRTCPIDAVVRGLHAVNADDLRLRVLAHMAGEAAMMNFIRNAKIGRVQFEKWAYDDDGGRTRNDVTMSLATRTGGESIRTRVLEWATTYYGFADAYTVDQEIDSAEKSDSKKPRRTMAQWRAEQAERKTEKEHAKSVRKQQRRSASHDAAGDLKQDLFTSTVDIDFNDVGVEMDDGTTKKLIKPGTDFRRFTYVLGAGYVSDEQFFSNAEATAANMLDLVQKLQLKVGS